MNIFSNKDGLMRSAKKKHIQEKQFSFFLSIFLKIKFHSFTFNKMNNSGMSQRLPTTK